VQEIVLLEMQASAIGTKLLVIKPLVHNQLTKFEEFGFLFGSNNF